MREAQKMMQDPAFQAQMKKMTKNPAFQAHMKQSQDMLKDPEKVKELEEKMQERLKEGTELLEKAKKATSTKEGDDKQETEETGGDDEKKDLKRQEKDDGDEMPDIPTLSLNWSRVWYRLPGAVGISRLTRNRDDTFKNVTIVECHDVSHYLCCLWMYRLALVNIC